MDDYICHFGRKGMKWGIRRYQNEDGSLTAAGRRRYGQQLSRPTASDETTSYRVSKDDRTDKVVLDRVRKKKLDPEKMSTQNIQRAINREQKIRQYHDVKDEPKKGDKYKDSASDVAKTLKSMSEQSKKKISEQRKNKPRMDLSDMSLEDINKAITREERELRYNDLFAPDNVSKGQIQVDKILERVAAVAGIAATTVGVLDTLGMFDERKKK